MHCSHRLSWILVGCALFLAGVRVRAQGTAADYERSNQLNSQTRNKVFKTRVQPHWLADNGRFWYRNDLADGVREFVLVDAVEGKREPAFDHVQLAAALTRQAGQDVRPSHLPLADLEFLEKANIVRFKAFDKNWRYDRGTATLREDAERPAPPKTGSPEEGQDAPETSSPSPSGDVLAEEGAEAEPEFVPQRGRGASREDRSPDGKWVAFFREFSLYLRDSATGTEIPLTRDGTPGDGYASGLYWSPDSTKLVALRTRSVEVRKVYMVESSPRDQLQPKLHTLRYAKPGDDLAVSKPHLFDVAARREVPVSDGLFPTPWSITQLRWEPDSSRFSFLYNQRGHQVLRLVAVDGATGKARALVDEVSKTFIDYAGKLYLHAVPETHELIWMSERDGWNHLYLYDSQAGQVKNAITHGPWVVRGVERVDDAKRQVWFRASGIYPEQDPYYIHYGRVNYDGTGLVFLTAGDGTHTITYSPDRRFLLATYSRVDLPPVTELRRVEDGKQVCELERADVRALLATGWKAPERFVAPGRDGTTVIYGVIFRPTNFDPNRKYPILEDIYAGPQSSFVPKAFAPFFRQQAMAELGFVVVQMDGMGTSNRSKAFHDICWKNLGDAGFPDRILWIKAAAAKYPYLDLGRIGIYGVSAGGQSALGGLLMHPEFYQVGVAACGCHDNRMDKIWWNELWMGWPVGPHYAAQSNVTNARKLQGKLFLIVGEMDNNVDPASTMQVVDALIQANKDFDLLVVPGGGHGLGGRYGERRQADFLVRHLLGVEPRSAAQ